MKPETFFDNFEMLAEAPNGVQKLRELILQLAFQGMLVQKDEKDEQVTVLMEKIKAERERLIRENKIKKDVVLPPINLNEIPFIIPKSWVWVRLSDICPVITDGEHLTPKYSDSGVPLLSAKNIGQKDLDFSDVNYVTEGDAQSFWSRCKPEKGDILVVSRGGGVGRTIISNKKDFCLMGSVLLFKVSEHYLNKFLYYFLRSTIGNERLRTASGATAQPAIYILHLKRNCLVPLCPSNEQHRIVSKVNQLMSLCDELESRQQKKRESRAHINSAALDQLLSARAPGEFAEGWRRISENFDLLYDAPENVGALRKAILQLAIQGKLVPQNSNDEPASILLERIIVEKKKLMKEGKIKETGKFPIENEDAPFEIPSKWKWTCLYNIGKINPRNITEDDTEVSFIPMTLISETSIKPIGSEKRRWGEVKKAFTHFAEDDVVLAKITPCFQNGKSAVMRGLTNNLGAGTTELHVFRQILNESVYPEYVLLYLRSPQFLSEGVEKMTGTAGQKRVPKEYFAGNPFPLPPFEEQRRIATRVDQIMSLCDKLEAGLMRSQAESEKLMEAVVGRMLVDSSE